MWNLVVCALLTGATIVLYDGSPGHPHLDSLWTMADQLGVTFFGTSAAFLAGCAKAGLAPGSDHDLSRVRTVGSTGSPLSADTSAWIYNHVRDDVTSAFVGGCPLLPVYAGEMQCRYLGVDARAFDPAGKSVIGAVGELVIAQPMPSMPLYFWNDPGHTRYVESYFQTYPGVWRHGDFVLITERGTVIIQGRSDSTINRAGIRIGTSDIYDVVESMPEIKDSLVVDVDFKGERTEVLLFVVLADGALLNEDLIAEIKGEIRRQLSPRHVPDAVLAAPEIPRTLNGKKLEVPVKRLLMGVDPGIAVSSGAMANPTALRHFMRVRRELSARPTTVRPK
jgi:acetoacetyl-CoA synthetase